MTCGFFTTSSGSSFRNLDPVVQDNHPLREGHQTPHHVFDQQDGDSLPVHFL